MDPNSIKNFVCYGCKNLMISTIQVRKLNTMRTSIHPVQNVGLNIFFIYTDIEIFCFEIDCRNNILPWSTGPNCSYLWTVGICLCGRLWHFGCDLSTFQKIINRVSKKVDNGIALQEKIQIHSVYNQQVLLTTHRLSMSLYIA